MCPESHCLESPQLAAPSKITIYLQLHFLLRPSVAGCKHTVSKLLHLKLSHQQNYFIISTTRPIKKITKKFGGAPNALMYTMCKIRMLPLQPRFTYICSCHYQTADAKHVAGAFEVEACSNFLQFYQRNLS